MLFTPKEIACTADRLAFLQDIRRHELPIHSIRFNGGNRYDLVSFCISMCVHELREYQLSLAAIGRLLRQVDLDELSIKTEQFREGYVDRLIVLIPQQPDRGGSFHTTVTSWAEAFQYTKHEKINSIFSPLLYLLRGKLEGHW